MEYWFQLLEVLIKLSDGWDYFYNSVITQRIAEELLLDLNEPYVDLKRFMGDWYVVASIPTFLEKEAYNPKESYRLNADGTIATAFTFNSGALDGSERAFYPTGFVRDAQSNAVWGMQFIWPVKADFRIVFVDDDYRHTVIGRQKRDFLWIMARHPNVKDIVLEDLIKKYNKH